MTLISGYEPELVRGRFASGHEYLFALFLWTRLAYDKREGLGLAALERYGFDFASEDTQRVPLWMIGLNFSVSFLRDYIHYDVLSATEYQSEGSLDVLRLNLRLRFPGYAWLTHCAERSNDCNTGFPVTPSKVRELRTYTPHLEPARASHQCYTCGKYLAIYVNFTCSRACAKKNARQNMTSCPDVWPLLRVLKTLAYQVALREQEVLHYCDFSRSGSSRAHSTLIVSSRINTGRSSGWRVVFCAPVDP